MHFIAKITQYIEVEMRFSSIFFWNFFERKLFQSSASNQYLNFVGLHF
jgi:hypothetical protein